MSTSRKLLALAMLLSGAVTAYGQPAPKGPLDRDVSASLTGNKEIPPTPSTAKGELKGILTMATREFRWTLTCSGLTGPVTASHFHGPASEDKNANVALPLAGDCSVSPVEGTVVLEPDSFTNLLEGKWYINVHTAQFPNGEIRGQVAVIRRGD